MPHQYATTHQCARCGVTRPTSTLKLARRIDDVNGIDEMVHVCTDERLCARMRREADERLARELAKPITGKGGRPKKPKPLEPLKLPAPVKRSKKTLQFFPALDTPNSRKARRSWARRLARLMKVGEAEWLKPIRKETK